MSSKVFVTLFLVVIVVAVCAALENNPSPKHDGEYDEHCEGEGHCAAKKFLYCDPGTEKCQCMKGVISEFGPTINTDWYPDHNMCMGREGSYCTTASSNLMCWTGLKCAQVQGMDEGVGTCVKAAGGGSCTIYSNILLLVLGLLTLKVVCRI